MSSYGNEELRKAMRLYAVTDNAWLGDRTLADCVKQAIAGGATFVQLRNKGADATHENTVELACELAAICHAEGIPFVVDDDVEAARVSGADGVHVGQSDAACATARSMLGPDAIIGVSAQTLDQALAAQDAGADYLGVGAMIETSTKPDAVAVTKEELARICATVDIPVVAIGGLHCETLDVIAGTGVDGAAVVSAIFAADDIEQATRELAAALEEVL